ncbi:hypothetical protein ACFLUA_04740 [Chloroflexota bacterium]
MDPENILISRPQFKQALNTLRIASKGQYSPEMVFSCQGENLFIRLGGSEIKLEGKGRFNSQARLSSKALKSLILALPEEDPLPISRHPDRLGIGNLRLSCRWETQAPTKISVAINSDEMDYLRLAKNYSYDEIAKSGLEPKVEAATNTLNERVLKAFDLLKQYGIEYKDLYNLVDQAIQNKNTRDSKKG